MDSLFWKWSAGRITILFISRIAPTGMLFIPAGMVTAIADEYAARKYARGPGAGGGAGEL